VPGVRPMSYDGCPTCNAGLEATSGCCFECDDLRAGITRAENDLAEARNVARLLHRGVLPGGVDLPVVYPWLTEAE
jgi:hypothetical protein